MAASYERFIWKQSKPGRWERDVDEVEQFYTSLGKAYAGSGRTYFAITAHISYTVVIEKNIDRLSTEQRIQEALKKAWLHLRYTHPTIASWVEYDPTAKECKKIYEGFHERNDQNSWLEDTFRIIADSKKYRTGQEFSNADPPVPKLPTLFLVQRPISSNNIQADLVLRAHHDIIDGIGTLHFWDRLFDYASQAYDEETCYQLPHFGDEWKNLSPPLRVAAAIPETLTSEQTARIERTKAVNSALREKVEIATVPLQSDATLPGKHQRIALKLDNEQTRRLLGACKALGASVTHIYHAAIAVALRDAQKRSSQARSVRYINYSLINERDHCLPPYSTPAHAVSTYHSVSGQSLAIDLGVPAASVPQRDQQQQKGEFRGIIQEIKNFYTEIRDDKEHIALAPAYWTLTALPYDPVPTPVPSPNPTPSASISSMGVIDKIIQPHRSVFELDDPWVTGEELGTGLGFFLGTFKGELSFSVAYNDVWHNLEEARGYLNRCQEIILECAGIAM